MEIAIRKRQEVVAGGLIECRDDHREIIELLRALDDPATHAATTAERFASDPPDVSMPWLSVG